MTARAHPSARLERAAAAGLAAWALARLTGAERAYGARTWAAPLLSFTPQVTVAALAGALLLRDRRAAGTAAAAAAALTAVVAPRALPGRPAARGPVLRVLTANLLVGRADPAALIALADRCRADVLCVQELTAGAADRLHAAGLGGLLPYAVADTFEDSGRGSGVYSRHPVKPGLPLAPALLAQPAVRLELPGGSVQLACVHARPPRPMWSPEAVAEWRRELGLLPAPGHSPVILAGDFNATVDHRPLRALLRRGYTDAAVATGHGLVPTWGPRAGRRPALLAIDHVLASPGCAVRATAVHRLPGTDHRALYAEIQLP